MMKIEETTGLDRVYRFIVNFVTENCYSPSVGEICEGTGVRSKASVHEYLCTLKMMGKIDMKRNTARTIRLIGYKWVKEEST